VARVSYRSRYRRLAGGISISLVVSPSSVARQGGSIPESLDVYREGFTPYEAKIAALERKVGQLTMEVDILKKLRERTSPPEGTPSVISGPAVSPSSKDAKS